MAINVSRVLKSGRKGGKQIIVKTADERVLPGNIEGMGSKVVVEGQQGLPGQRAAAIPSSPGFIQPEVAAALAGVFRSIAPTVVKPEIVAAATGAVLHVSAIPGFLEDEDIIRPVKRLWGEVGRTKIVHLRKNFTSLRRRKSR